jgi:hypothetical protein
MCLLTSPHSNFQAFAIEIFHKVSKVFIQRNFQDLFQQHFDFVGLDEAIKIIRAFTELLYIKLFR